MPRKPTSRRTSSVPLHIRCKETRAIVEEMTAGVSSYSRSTNPLFLHMSLIKFMMSFEQISDPKVTPNLFDVQLCWDGPATADSQALASEHLRCIDALNGLITALLLKLDRRTWADAGSEEDLAFKCLWGMLFQACTMFDTFPHNWLQHLLPLGHPVCATVHALMLYLLPLTCPGSSSNTPWAPPLGRAVTCNETRVMIMPAWCVVRNLCNTDGPGATAAIRSLPPAFVHTLCTLACEKLDASLPCQDRVGDFFARITGTITTCVTAAVAAKSERDIAPFRSLAVLDAAERGVALMQHIPEPLLEQVRQVLQELGS
ncbi:MAG: hypothetical protein WDW38_005883 [Sanguina aurantia]